MVASEADVTGFFLKLACGIQVLISKQRLQGVTLHGHDWGAAFLRRGYPNVKASSINRSNVIYTRAG